MYPTHYRPLDRNTPVDQYTARRCTTILLRGKEESKPPFITLTEIFHSTYTAPGAHRRVIADVAVAKPFFELAIRPAPLRIADAFVICHAFAVVTTDGVIGRGHAVAGAVH